MKLSVIIPVYNERKTILQILKKVESVKFNNVDKEVIIVDDCSTDGTRQLLKKLNKHVVAYHDVNKGKGAAIRTGLKHATGDVFVVQDADLEYNPQDMKNLIEPIQNGTAKVVYGSRFLEKKYKLYGKGKVILPSHYIGNKFLNLITALLYQTKITDMETCYKMFTRDVLKNISLHAQRFEFEPEITSKILRKGYKIVELPISYHGRGFKEGKKITWKDGFHALYCLCKYRLFD